MCLICDCASFDCWPDKTWCIFFGIWNAIIGFIGMISTSMMLDKELAKPKLKADLSEIFLGSDLDKHIRSDAKVALFVVVLICVILHLLSGIFILLGLFMDMKVLFSFGKGMSHVLPWVCVCSIFLPVVQLICLYRVCRYYKGM